MTHAYRKKKNASVNEELCLFAKITMTDSLIRKNFLHLVLKFQSLRLNLIGNNPEIPPCKLRLFMKIILFQDLFRFWEREKKKFPSVHFCFIGNHPKIPSSLTNHQCLTNILISIQKPGDRSFDARPRGLWASTEQRKRIARQRGRGGRTESSPSPSREIPGRTNMKD